MQGLEGLHCNGGAGLDIRQSRRPAEQRRHEREVLEVHILVGHVHAQPALAHPNRSCGVVAVIELCRMHLAVARTDPLPVANTFGHVVQLSPHIVHHMLNIGQTGEVLALVEQTLIPLVVVHQNGALAHSVGVGLQHVDGFILDLQLHARVDSEVDVFGRLPDVERLQAGLQLNLAGVNLGDSSAPALCDVVEGHKAAVLSAD